MINSGSGKYNQDAVFTFIYVRRMYFKVSTARAKMFKYVNIMGVFEDTKEEVAFVSCDGISNQCLDVAIYETRDLKEYIKAF